MESHREFIKQMTIDAWNAYQLYAWGAETIAPVTYEPINGPHRAATLLSAMSTLWMMNLKNQFTQCTNWVDLELDYSEMTAQFADVSLLIVYHLGPLLSCYALSNNRLFIRKASTLATLLAGAYHPQTGLPYQKFYIYRSLHMRPKIWLSDAGQGEMEYRYLAHLTGNKDFRKRVDCIRKTLKSMANVEPIGVYMEEIDTETGLFCSTKVSPFIKSIDFYYNLITFYIFDGQRDIEALKLFTIALTELERLEVIAQGEDGRVYLRTYDFKSGTYCEEMGDMGCWLVPALILYSTALKALKWNGADVGIKNASEKATKYLNLAIELTETYHYLTTQSRTGLLPFYFTNNEELEPRETFASCNQNIAVAYYYAYRATKNTKYRQYAWELAQSIDRHCRTVCGSFSNIRHINQLPTMKTNYAPPHFIALTCKFLYLTFLDDDDGDDTTTSWPMDRWIFTLTGQPLPIGKMH